MTAADIGYTIALLALAAVLLRAWQETRWKDGT